MKQTNFKFPYFFVRWYVFVWMVMGQISGLYANNGGNQGIDVDLSKVIISLDEQNRSLKHVFKAIESKTELSFFYDKKIVDDDAKITIKKKNVSLKDILEDLSV